jgi:wyosine [tRNA(Phe)-imidazoG37] synthetase (radical SAM superfamily)
MDHFPPGAIVEAVATRIGGCRASGQPIDYAAFVPDGEPTLDAHLGEAIRGVTRLGLPVAVLTNGSLLWRDDVRQDLGAADLVSVKVDTVEEAIWRRVDRPVRRLRLETILEGIRRFRAGFPGDLVTETMLIQGVNDDDETVWRTAAFIAALEPLRAYVAIPTRPPTQACVRAPSMEVTHRAASIFRSLGLPTELLVEDIPDGFATSPDPADGLLGIAAVHPMTEADARAYLVRSGGDWSIALRLLDQGRLTRVRHDGRTYLRCGRQTAVTDQRMPRTPRAGAQSGERGIR